MFFGWMLLPISTFFLHNHTPRCTPFTHAQTHISKINLVDLAKTNNFFVVPGLIAIIANRSAFFRLHSTVFQFQLNFLFFKSINQIKMKPFAVSAVVVVGVVFLFVLKKRTIIIILIIINQLINNLK